MVSGIMNQKGMIKLHNTMMISIVDDIVKLLGIELKEEQIIQIATSLSYKYDLETETRVRIKKATDQ